jgi:Mg2+ and Co2+ transporter CorA
MLWRLRTRSITWSETPDYFYIVVHGPHLNCLRDHDLPEIDIFLSERFLVTVHDPPVASITDTRKRTSADVRRALEPGIDLLLHAILDHLVDQYQPMLEALSRCSDCFIKRDGYGHRSLPIVVQSMLRN